MVHRAAEFTGSTCEQRVCPTTHAAAELLIERNRVSSAQRRSSVMLKPQGRRQFRELRRSKPVQ